jgi:Tfp pilus assembly protein PilO
MNVSDLRQLDLKNIGSWPRPAKALAIGLTCLLVIAAGWYVDLQDQATLLTEVEQKELALKQDLESKAAKVVNLDALTVQIEDIKQSFGDMLKRLPNKTENTPPTIVHKRTVSARKDTLVDTKHQVDVLLLDLHTIDQGANQFSTTSPIELFQSFSDLGTELLKSANH